MRRTPRLWSYALILAVLAVVTTGVAQAAEPKDAGGTPRDVVVTGIPGRTVDGVQDAGAIEVRSAYGETQLVGAPEPLAGARFGAVVQEEWIGSYPDNEQLYTFVGAPGLTVNGEPNAGGVYVFERDHEQLQYVDLLTQDDPRIPGKARTGAQFGASMDSDYTALSFPDTRTAVFVGVPGLPVDGESAAGGVLQIRFRPASPGPDFDIEITDAFLHTLASSEAGRAPAAGDRLGTSVHLEYFSSNERYSFFAGAPGAAVEGKDGAGLVLLAETDAKGRLFHPGVRGVPSEPERGERFGTALSYTPEDTADSDWERARLAIGAPGKDVHGNRDAGKVYTLKWGNWTTWKGDRGFSQDSPDDGTDGGGEPVGGRAEPGDRFGAEVRFYDENSSVFPEPKLWVGAPGEDVGAAADAGAIFGLFGIEGLDEADVGGTPGTGRRFGAVISEGEHSDPYWDEYLIGVPGANDGAGSLVYGIERDDASGVDWQPAWTLDGDRRPGDGYGSSMGHADSARS